MIIEYGSPLFILGIVLGVICGFAAACAVIYVILGIRIKNE